MRIATRLLLLLGPLLFLTIFIYAALAQRQRVELLSGAHVRESETLGRTLQIVASSALRDGRLADLNSVLRRVADSPETHVVAVLNEQGEVLAGDAEAGSEVERAFSCSRRPASDLLHAGAPAGAWTECRDQVYWTVLPLQPHEAALVIGQRPLLMQRSLVLAQRRYVLLTLGMVLVLTCALILSLHFMLTRPIGEIVAGVRSRGQGEVRPLRISTTARELVYLVTAFNEMSDELLRRESDRMREAEERVALEKRLAQSEKLALVGRFSGGLAHELGSPLSVIQLRAETIAEHPHSPDPVRRHAEWIRQQVERITDLVNGLLHLAHRSAVVFEQVDLGTIARVVGDEVRASAAAADVEIEVVVPAQPVMVHGQGTLLHHAIQNLVRNAIQALGSHRGERHLLVEVETGAGAARVVVEDTGPGVPQEHLDRIFEPFFTTQQLGRGTGLGLAVSRAIAEEHGGELNVENRPGGGVRATLTLPPDEATSPTAGRAA